jgi:hypothetical protein
LKCWNRRIAVNEKIKKEFAAWQKIRDNIIAMVNWQFTPDNTRVKLPRHYPTLELTRHEGSRFIITF